MSSPADQASLSIERSFAEQMDADDALAPLRQQFHIPERADGTEEIYLCGHSLGLQPRRTEAYVQEELLAWQRLGVKGHFHSAHPWMPYHRFLTQPMASIVGGLPGEVVTMNSLTVNLHLLMVSFYRPTPQRHRILIETHAFPSDHYVVESQIRFHGFDPAQSLLQVAPRQGEELIRAEDLLELIDREGDTIALILLPGVQYYTGQLLDLKEITRLGQQKGCVVGFDLAHAAGNVPLQLHDWDVDFACWCTYKYLNSGPGSVGAAFVHERHGRREDLPRFAGWWGHDEKTRFRMESRFVPMDGADGWQLSNPPILSLAAIRSSLEVFAEAGGVAVLRSKSLRLTSYLEFLLQQRLKERVEIVTPADPEARGCQLSVKVRAAEPKKIFARLEAAGVTGDWREPNVIRLTPVPLYNTFLDVWEAVETLDEIMAGEP